jgi:hypothetical protein
LVLCSQQVSLLVSCTIVQSCWQYDNPVSQNAGEIFVLYVLVSLALKDCWAQHVLVMVHVRMPLMVMV